MWRGCRGKQVGCGGDVEGRRVGRGGSVERRMVGYMEGEEEMCHCNITKLDCLLI